jgi:hypothetical protein
MEDITKWADEWADKLEQDYLLAEEQAQSELTQLIIFDKEMNDEHTNHST